MKIKCNVHVALFDPNQPGENDTLPATTALGLSGEWSFIYDYPLQNEAVFKHVLIPETTALGLLLLGRFDYERIYATESDPGLVPGMLNRSASKGPYGIWGHYLEDLFFEGINIDKENRKICFAMGS